MKVKFNLIQAFRGFAALLVVIHHISAANLKYYNFSLFNNLFGAGWAGVDFFFVLSGFIITYAHYNDVLNGSNFFKFMYKRFVRIYPIYWLISSVSLLFFIKSGQISVYSDFLHILKSYFLIPHAEIPFLGVAWSMEFEVFFYLIFSIFILTKLTLVKIILPLWFLAIVILNIMGSTLSEHIIFNNYVLEFIMGSFTTYIYINWFKKVVSYKETFLIFGIILFLCVFLIADYTTFIDRTALASRFLYGLASSTILLGLVMIDKLKSITLNSNILLIGNASYVIYLFHPLVSAAFYRFTSSFLISNQLLYIYITAMVCFIIAVLSGIALHLLIEIKILKALDYESLFKRNRSNH